MGAHLSTDIMASNMTAPAVRTDSRKAAGGTKRFYLFLYNFLSLCGWFYILYRLVLHLSSANSAWTYHSLLPGHDQHKALLDRTKSSYADVGDLVRYVQTGALLEILHVLLGLVRSGLGTTVSQVASRLVLVWGILIQFPQVRSHPAFTTMVFAWSVAEIVRYSTYALALFDLKLYPLEWLRYTLFYVLYPLGAGSEAWLMYRSLPYARYKFGKEGSLALTCFVLMWPIALAGMMSHMHAQRRKFIGRRGVVTSTGKGRATATAAGASKKKA